MSGYLMAAACAVLVCLCYGTGRAALSPRRTAAVTIVAGGILAAQFTIRPAGTAATSGLPTVATGFVAACLVFVLLPLLAGRYVADQRKAADQERLRERVRIARDMHDSLGRALSLAAIQAAALEVSDLPAPQRQAAARLGTSIRAGVTDLHEIVAVLRGPARGMSAIDELIAEFRAAGADVSIRSHGTPVPLSGPADEAAYRVIEEGLTNAVRHAPGHPVSITVSWRTGSLTLTIVNLTGLPVYTPGSGLDGLRDRLREAGGTLTHELADGTLSHAPTDGMLGRDLADVCPVPQFRLRARLPLTRRARLRSALAGCGLGPALAGHGLGPGLAGHGLGPGLARHRLGLGFAVGFVLLVVVPATVLLGVR